MAFKIYVIHHSHTDIGYTDYQEQIEANHVYYIRHAIHILNRAHTEKKEWLGFVWQCEGWWAVEKFFEVAEEKEIEDFWKYVKSGEIGISSNYINMAELIGKEILEEYLNHARIQGEQEGFEVVSAMTADINGYSWGYADALANAGTKNLLSFLHTHHGRYPLFEKQTPFWWETPSGKEILVWLGDHYLLGNELGIDGQRVDVYTCTEDGIESMEIENVIKAERRISNYVKTLKRQGYPYDFTVVGVSGIFIDNACPSPLTIEFIKKYNQKHGQEIELCMVTLDEFFARLREEEKKKPFPKYSGDWTDWWADGVGSTPVHVQHFREAQRKVKLAEKLWEKEKANLPEGTVEISGQFEQLIEDAKYNLMIYSEHTWGHSASIVEPYDPGVNRLDLRKGLYAQRAHEAASKALLLIAGKNGASPLLYRQGEQEVVVMNPEKYAVSEMVSFETERLPGEYVEIVDLTNGQVVPHQVGSFSRGKRLYFISNLNGGEKRHYQVREGSKPWVPTAGRYTAVGAEQICDMESELWTNGKTVSPWRIENDWIRIVLDEEKGVTEIYDKQKEMSIVRKDTPYPVFAPIYEHTPTSEYGQYNTRRYMGRNRKSMKTERFVGKVTDIRVLESGKLFDRVELMYELPGTKSCFVLLTVYKEEKKLDIDFRLHKESVWDPENVYLAFPLTAGEEDTCWCEKGNLAFRPRIDQLPGSCTDFYLIQNGVWFTGEKGTVLLMTPDVPLITMGEIKAHPIVFQGENEKNSDMLYSWVMNNFWETNFKAEMGGFHQYHYSILLTDEKEPEAVRTIAEQRNQGMFVFKRTTICE